MRHSTGWQFSWDHSTRQPGLTWDSFCSIQVCLASFPVLIPQLLSLTCGDDLVRNIRFCRVQVYPRWEISGSAEYSCTPSKNYEVLRSTAVPLVIKNYQVLRSTGVPLVRTIKFCGSTGVSLIQAIAKTSELVRNPITDLCNTTKGQGWDIKWLSGNYIVNAWWLMCRMCDGHETFVLLVIRLTTGLIWLEGIGGVLELKLSELRMYAATEIDLTEHAWELTCS